MMIEVDKRIADYPGKSSGYATIGMLAILPAISLSFLSDISTLRGNSPQFVTFSFVFALVLCLLRPIQLILQRHPHPLQQLKADFSLRWPWMMTVAFLLVVLPITLQVSSYVKKLIPNIIPFYADFYLISIDRILFFGYDPWRITHAVIGPLGTQLLDSIYGFWHVAQIALLIWIVLTTNRRFQLQAAISFQLAWLVLGAGLATILSSVGPCFIDDIYGSDYFAPLMEKIAAEHGLYSTNGMNYLLATKGTDSFGSGISAMPSLHVGIAVLIALCIRDQWPRLQLIGWLYALIIYVGSIHLGWHYASDGLVSGFGIWLIWSAVKSYLEYLERCEANLRSSWIERNAKRKNRLTS